MFCKIGVSKRILTFDILRINLAICKEIVCYFFKLVKLKTYQFPAVHRIAGNLCLNRTGLTSFEQWVRFFHVKKE